MVLPGGITGFLGRGDEPPVVSDVRAFRGHCHEAARRVGGRVTSVEQSYPDGLTRNFAVAVLELSAGPLAAALNAHYPLLAFADPPAPGETALRFRQCPRLAKAFASFGIYRVATAEGTGAAADPRRPERTVCCREGASGVLAASPAGRHSVQLVGLSSSSAGGVSSVPRRMLVPEPCPECGAVELDSKELNWDGTSPDGRPTFGGQSWIQCAACGKRFGRGADGVLISPEATAEYEQLRAQELVGRYRAVMERRAREAAEWASAAGNISDAETDSSETGDDGRGMADDH